MVIKKNKKAIQKAWDVEVEMNRRIIVDVEGESVCRIKRKGGFLIGDNEERWRKYGR